ncbi:alpha-galactosidase [Parasphingorhabdus marina DSM 22363]|uniref:Alpha-galactosidase n=1 Tax=Parasphingorhabdus marina DSM 22363 TaxID=1123272 RepID=A0A1N6CX82_9SPHN|nr:alpha-galactosidase [Parasphingorhabdus marina]SIN63014.1 alpha-galactosidase [Parasphingorhabdus marina DSM 22363]
MDAGEMTLVVDAAAGQPAHIVYWGRRIAEGQDAADLVRLGSRQHVFGSETQNVRPGLMAEAGRGFAGTAGLSVHRAGRDWGVRLTVVAVKENAGQLVITTRDPDTQIFLQHRFSADAENGILAIAAVLRNEGQDPLTVNHISSICLPVPQHLSDIIGFSGRWAGEFRTERLRRFSGSWLRENRRGRTSHDSFPGVILCEENTGELSGEACAVHLAWSGNHHLRVDTGNSGDVLLSTGALLFPGEAILAPGEEFSSPPAVVGYSANGLSGLSRRLHDHVRSSLLRAGVRSKLRPVHYNSWEAVYFDHDPEQLKAMASKAAEIGVERFVLDDGWFGSRRNDQSGLGDWVVSDEVYPDGLTPLVDHVTGLGMEMGIWFEPEMVNPDSDLYRAHPDWVLQIEGLEQVPFRNQLVLDLSRPEVCDHLFDRIDAILSDHDIRYIKWDMNRDLNHPAGQDGRSRAFDQIQALYDLIDRVRTAHPEVEIESCSSGGGRADFGILAHTDRIWTSDSNDALDRQEIQRGASHFLPLCVTGAHVGPAQCHITGRKLSMAMRAGTAIMGHMGVEMNLLGEPGEDLEELARGIALYKKHRQLIHDGDFYRVDNVTALNIIGVVARDRREALWSVAYMASLPERFPPRFICAGLERSQAYRVRLVWPEDWRSITSPSIVEELDLTGKGAVFSGELLMTVGLQLPTAFPETVLLFHLAEE